MAARDERTRTQLLQDRFRRFSRVEKAFLWVDCPNSCDFSH